MNSSLKLPGDVSPPSKWQLPLPSFREIIEGGKEMMWDNNTIVVKIKVSWESHVHAKI